MLSHALSLTRLAAQRSTLHPFTRPASCLATAGLDADARDVYELASDFAARELAPHARRWDEEKV